MSNTTKWEHPRDTIRVRQQEARQARPAGRDDKAFEADLALDESEGA
jgi:hypothetical protein